MPNFFRKSLLFSFLLLSFLSCKNDPKTEAPQTPPQPEMVKVVPVPIEGAETFLITEGIVNWSGTKTVSKSGHNGTITIESGELLVNQGQIISGKVVLDMNSISVTDIKDPGERRDLESHLKDSDFFEANKFPKAEFVFEQVLPNTTPNFNWVLRGNLSMKGKTLPVNIPAKISIDGDLLQAETPSFPINRTAWGVNFHSGILGTVKDKMIDDMVPISLKITAKKK